MEIFEKLADELDSDFVEDETKKEIQELKQKNKELSKHVKKSKKENYLEDKDYIQKELMDLVDKSKEVLQTLQDDIKVGTSFRAFEVYGTMVTSISKSLMDLQALNKVESDKKNAENLDSNGKVKTNINVNVSGKELLDMIKEAKEGNQLNKIDADFKIIDK